MNIRSSLSVTSSVATASFRTVQALDSRGLPCHIRRETMSMRRLREYPLPPLRTLKPQGRIRTGKDIRKVRT